MSAREAVLVLAGAGVTTFLTAILVLMACIVAHDTLKHIRTSDREK